MIVKIIDNRKVDIFTPDFKGLNQFEINLKHLEDGSLKISIAKHASDGDYRQCEISIKDYVKDGESYNDIGTTIYLSCSDNDKLKLMLVGKDENDDFKTMVTNFTAESIVK